MQGVKCGEGRSEVLGGRERGVGSEGVRCMSV